jgi:glycosyltransferase involved in cell wall biosynthesis
VRTRLLLSFSAWAGGMSGGDRHLLEMAAHWREHVDIEAMAPPQAAELLEEFLPGVNLHPIGWGSPRVNASGPLLSGEYLRRSLRAQIRPPRADVVIAASHFLPDACALAAAVRRGAAGVTYVYHLVGERTERSARSLWSRYDERASLAILRRRAAVVFACNSATAGALENQGFAPTRTDVGINTAAFAQARPAGAPPRIAFVARLARSKGVLDAVQALALVRRSVPAVQLVMVGSGPERGAAERRAQELGVSDAIEWTGFVSEERKHSLMAQARVFLAPSYEEGWGIAVAEALASGLPVVAYRLPILDEVFGPVYTGVELGSVAQLAAALQTLLTDDAAAERAGSRGREAVAKYDVGRIAQQELEVILGYGSRPR